MYTRVHIAQKKFFIVELRKNNKQRKKEKMKTKKGLFSKMATASQAIFLTIYDTLIYFYEIIVPVLMLSFCVCNITLGFDNIFYFSTLYIFCLLLFCFPFVLFGDKVS